MMELKRALAVVRENVDGSPVEEALQAIRADFAASTSREDRRPAIQALGKAVLLRKDSDGDLTQDEDTLFEIATTYLEIARKWPKAMPDKMVCDLTDIAILSCSMTTQMSAENALKTLKEKNPEVSTERVRLHLTACLDQTGKEDKTWATRALAVWKILHPNFILTQAKPHEASYDLTDVSAQPRAVKEEAETNDDATLRKILTALPFYTDARDKIIAEADIQEIPQEKVQRFLKKEMPVVLTRARNPLLSGDEQTAHMAIYKEMLDRAHDAPCEQDATTLIVIAKNFKNETGKLAFDSVRTIYARWPETVTTSQGQLMASIALNQKLHKAMRESARDLLFWNKHRLPRNVVDNVFSSVSTTRCANQKPEVRKAAQELLTLLDPHEALKIDKGYQRLFNELALKNG